MKIDPLFSVVIRKSKIFIVLFAFFKGSIVAINIYSVHMDENYWDDPEEFRPERHLSDDGTSVIKTDHLLPFGAGECLFVSG